jgi:flagellar protein FlaG
MEASASALVNPLAGPLGTALSAQRAAMSASQAAASAQPAAGTAPQEQPQAELAGQVAELNDLLKGTWVSLRIDIDKESRHVVTTVVDRDTGDVIRQIPSEEFLRVSRAMNKLQGLLVSQKA